MGDASFETVALRPPQDEQVLMALRKFLILRSAQGARLEGRTALRQPAFYFSTNLQENRQ